MFALADESLAVANALEEVIRRATAVIGANSAEGVASWLSEHALS
jgi:hydroxymethylpyrimidine pyrophosphatase-like HAD family hydrolase